MLTTRANKRRQEFLTLFYIGAVYGRRQVALPSVFFDPSHGPMQEWSTYTVQARNLPTGIYMHNE
jgi:hypothetical protein